MASSLIGVLLSLLTSIGSSGFITATPQILPLLEGLRLPILTGAIILPLSLPQFVWLRSRVRSAWLWPLVSIVTVWIVSFVIPQYQAQARYENGNNLVLMATLLHGCMQGGVMRYLWMQEKEKEKAKNEFATDDDEERLQRLQENEAAVMASISESRGSQQNSSWRL